MIKRNLLTVLLGSLACASAFAASPFPSVATPAASALVRDLVQTAKPALDDQQARSKPRVKGGSGCDTPQDVAEHPECRALPEVKDDLLSRSKPRVKGGSGCDDPDDLIEHPECRPNAVEIKLPV